jgi:hypothetical protein
LAQGWRGWLVKRLIGCAVILAVGWLADVGVMNWLAWHSAVEQGKLYPNLAAVLQPLPDTTIAPEGITHITRFGYSLSVPWKELESERDMKLGHLLSFRDGGNVMLFNPAEASDGAKAMRGKTAQENGLMRFVFGSKTLSSNYELMSAALKARPDDVHWWSGRRRNVEMFLLLINKEMVLHKSPLFYAIQTPSLEGYQIGDPQVAPYVVTLELFDSQDRHYTIWVTGQNKQPLKMTQAEINAMAASIAPMP